MTDKNETICGCLSGYIWQGKSCVNIEEKPEICKVNVFYFPSIPGLKSDARRMYGPQRDGDCVCPDNYSWQDDKCIIDKDTAESNSETESQSQKRTLRSVNKKNTFIEEEKKLITKIDRKLSKRLKGKILLQVESSGEGWYVNPGNEKKYYLGRPADAFEIMRELGLGISNNDFDYFNGIAPKRLAGKILLKVEDKGQAYYVNPNDLTMHFLGKPEDAFDVMRNLGLGISNNDIRKIDIEKIE